MATERCPAVKDGQQCSLPAGHHEQHQAAPDPGWAAPAEAPPIEWGGALLLVAGLLAIFGSFKPWIQATVASGGTITRSGLDRGGDGILTIALGILIALMGVAILSRRGSPRIARIGAFVVGVALAIVACLDIASVYHRISTIGISSATFGAGLMLVAFAAVLAVIGAILPVSNRRSR